MYCKQLKNFRKFYILGVYLTFVSITHGAVLKSSDSDLQTNELEEILNESDAFSDDNSNQLQKPDQLIKVIEDKYNEVVSDIEKLKFRYSAKNKEEDKKTIVLTGTANNNRRRIRSFAMKNIRKVHGAKYRKFLKTLRKEASGSGESKEKITWASQRAVFLRILAEHKRHPKQHKHFHTDVDFHFIHYPNRKWPKYEIVEKSDM